MDDLLRTYILPVLPLPNAWRPITMIIPLYNVAHLAVQAPTISSAAPRHIRHLLSVSFIFGAAGTSSNAATTGGVVASGEGTCSELIWPKPSELLRLGVKGGGLPADPDAVAETAVGVAGGCVPELNSAQRGHLRFVSEKEKENCDVR
jgi:hypothetical protein